MTIDDQKQQFSFAYARAVAAVARVAVDQPSLDDDSIDLSFRQKSVGGIVRLPQIDAQVKCTESAGIHANHIAYPLKLKNYEELRPINVSVPRILIVVTVPDDLANWLNHSEQELAMRECGYWVSLRGMPATTNGTNVTVHLPRANQFTVAQLAAMMQRLGNGQMP